MLLLDYRGFGRSEGRPSFRGAHRDVEDALRFIERRAEWREGKQILYGQSLGGAIAITAAAKTKVPLDLVTAESTFSSYRGIGRETSLQQLPQLPCS